MKLKISISDKENTVNSQKLINETLNKGMYLSVVHPKTNELEFSKITEYNELSKRIRFDNEDQELAEKDLIQEKVLIHNQYTAIEKVESEIKNWGFRKHYKYEIDGGVLFTYRRY